LREIVIQHIAAQQDTPTRVRVLYRPSEIAQYTERTTDFKFSLSQEERKLLQWYIEEYIDYPWGEFNTRAEKAEKLMETRGQDLFNAVFGNPETAAPML
jgi:hypothetical protein